MAFAARVLLNNLGRNVRQPCLCGSFYRTRFFSDEALQDLPVAPRGESEFWKRKMKTFFRLHDLDGDGKIRWADYLTIQERFVQVADLGMKEEVDVMLRFRKLWESWLGPVVDPKAYIKEERFIKAMKKAVSTPPTEKMDGQDEPTWSFFFKIFEMIDTNSNGTISVNEFNTFYTAYGLNEQMAKKAFDIIDKDGNGVISVEEFVNMAIDFLYNEDEDSVSKYFFGPLVD